jgi:hypothetical protein
MEKVLHAQNPNEVASATVLDADLGVGNRHLLVMSGIAIYDWVIDTDEIARGEVRVKLGVYARELEQASPFVGLASISNDETEFGFAVDQAEVQLDQDTGELSLYARTAVYGEWSGFNRFAYQVVATVVRVGSFIDGTIVWPTSLMRPPSNDPATVAPHLSVVANKHEVAPASGGLFGPTEKLTPITAGLIHSLSVGRTECKAEYRIDNPPMAMPLKVTLGVGPGFAPNPPAPVVWGQTSGPQVFTLHPNYPSETVDFSIGTLFIR